jgi:hypothetical protein
LADTDDPAEAAARLEDALERIAALSGRVAAAGRPDPAGAEVDSAAVAERLDALIAKLRAALAGRQI